jgi:hypothetical protein
MILQSQIKIPVNDSFTGIFIFTRGDDATVTMLYPCLLRLNPKCYVA